MSKAGHGTTVLQILVAVTILANAAAAQARPSPSSTNPPAIELVRAAVANEVAAANAAQIHHFFRSRKQTPHGSQTRLYVETHDAMAGITIAYNDQPLSAEQMQGEQGRLQRLIDNPAQLQRKRTQEKEDADRTLRMVKALPEAFLYDYDGTETGTANVGKEADPLVRLKFRPNPAYSPPSRVELALTGMQGVVLIDRDGMRIAKIDGTLFKEVGFGWGILGHLDKGGYFQVEQAALGDGTWEITRMHLRFSGKILFVKSFNFASDEDFSDFRPVPATLTFAQGVEMLKNEMASRAKDHTPDAAAAKNNSR